MYQVNHVCSFCGAPASQKCAGCKSEWYCGREHQKSMWKAHKKACKAAKAEAEAMREVMAKVSGGSTDVEGRIWEFVECVRCLKACSTERCRVPHPPHLQESLQTSISAGNVQESFRCGACNQQYMVGSSYEKPEEKTVVKGPSFCFDGQHSVAPLDSHDERRVFAHFLKLTVSDFLQSQLNGLSATQQDLETLMVVANGFYDDTLSFQLDLGKLPHLLDLQLVDVAFDTVNLTEDNAPCLELLRMQNVPNHCDVVVTLPRLRKVTIHYFSGDCTWVQDMLDVASALECFESYKLWTNSISVLTFAGPQLRSIDIHRSDSLEGVSIWAPRLGYLGLQACYSLQSIVFPETHALASTLPAGFRPTDFEVNTVNACLGMQAKHALMWNPRVRQAATVHGGMPTESMFAQMYGSGMWGDGMDDEAVAQSFEEFDDDYADDY